MKKGGGGGWWKRAELAGLLAYALPFYYFLLLTSLRLSAHHSSSSQLWGLTRSPISSTLLLDLSDSQWRSFRHNLPSLALLLAAFSLSCNVARRTLSLHGTGMARLVLVLSLAFVLYLHGACSLFLLGIAGGNYVIVKVLAGTSFLPVTLWFYNLSFLVCNRVFEGYSFSSLGEPFAFLDNYRGVLRWHINFNFVMLRMVSFGLDCHWARICRMSTVNWEKHTGGCDACRSGEACYLSRQERSVQSIYYSPEMYMSYLFYPPLYIAGPIMSFNAFASQLDSPQKTHSKLDICLYGLRWIACLVLMEILTHYCYYNSLAISGVWQKLSSWEIFVVGYGVLNFMWLKFLLIWRFFKLWALVGGVEVVENLPHCINNCYDLESFWKSWHASYNRWLVRYLYIPLGGARWRVLNIWVVFTFVAIWHDLEWKLLSWAWVTCLLMAPEVSVKAMMQTSMMQGLRESAIYRELCAMGGALNISGLMTANLIGFVVGPERMQWLLGSMLEPKNLPTSVTILCSFYIGTKLMFHVREYKMQQSTMKQAD